jgi:drug/metabolite transporter (DMT)-like permease
VNKIRNQYVIAAAVVWAAIWVATGVVADNEFDDMIPILGGGTVFLLILVPAALFRKRPEPASGRSVSLFD